MSRVLDVAAVLGDIFATDLGIKEAVEIEFIHHTRPDVYRVTAGGRSFIAHVDPDERQPLRDLRLNLRRVASLDDDRIPRVAAWSESEAGPKWSVVVCWEIEGEELNRRNFSDDALESLGDLLFKVHSIPGPAGTTNGPSRPFHEPTAFAGFAEALMGRLSDLPVRMSRVQAHCNEMAAYVERHASIFDRTPRLIHGDIQRCNIVVSQGGIGLIDWGDLSGGDYAYDLGLLKFLLDSVKPQRSASFLRDRARLYRDAFEDPTLELRLRFYLALAGLVRAFFVAGETQAFRAGRAWRVRASYLHSEAQWRNPLRIDGERAGAPAARNEDWALDIRQPLRGLYFLVAPKRIA